MRYLFPPACDAEQLVERLRVGGWWGQVVGAHGSGKSSLLSALAPALAAAGRRVISLALRDGQRSLGAGWRDLKAIDAHAQVVVDGYEQLSGWSRFRLKRRCRRLGAGLLATAHADVGLSTLLNTAPDLAMAQRLVAGLLPPGDRTIAPDDVARAWHARESNLREVFFDLYRLYEQRHWR